MHSVVKKGPTKYTQRITKEASSRLPTLFTVQEKYTPRQMAQENLARSRERKKKEKDKRKERCEVLNNHCQPSPNQLD